MGLTWFRPSSVAAESRACHRRPQSREARNQRGDRGQGDDTNTMATWTWNRALLLLLVVLLPLRLLSLRFRLHRTPGDRRSVALRSAVLLVLLSLVFAAASDPRPPPSNSQLEDMKLKVTQLESNLEENTALNSKILHLEEKRKLVEEMDHKIQFLQNTLFKIKASSSSSTHSKELLNALVEKVRLMWEESRRNNFNIHILESKAYDLEENLKAVTSEVDKMENIVTEQWIQIRQLEQSLHMTKTMTSRVHSRRKQAGCTMLKFIKSIRQCYLPEFIQFPDSVFLGDATSNSWISRAFEQFKILITAAKKWHHELQGFVKQWMEMNEFTATLANNEVVFFVTTAIVTFPVMSTWVLCSSFLGQQDW